jgi:hypothetical protein
MRLTANASFASGNALLRDKVCSGQEYDKTAVRLELCRSVGKVTFSASVSGDSPATRSYAALPATAHAFQDWMPKCSIYFIGNLAHVALSIGRWRRTAARAAAMTGNRARKRDHCWPAKQSLVWLISSIAARETPRHTSSARHPASHRVADSR